MSSLETVGVSGSLHSFASFKASDFFRFTLRQLHKRGGIRLETQANIFRIGYLYICKIRSRIEKKLKNKLNFFLERVEKI